MARMNFTAVALLCVWGAGVCAAQEAIEASTAIVTPDVRAEVMDGLRLNAGEFTRLAAPAGLPDRFTVDVALKGRSYAVQCSKHTVRDPGYVLLVQDERGRLTPHEPGPVNTYRGVVDGIEDSIVSASLIEGRLRLTIWLRDATVYVQPASDGAGTGEAGVYVVYGGEDVRPDPRAACGVDGRVHAPPVAEGDAAAGRASWFARAQIAFDADKEFYLLNGSSVANTESDINAVMNNVNVVYERDVRITHAITRIVVRTSEPDPYSSTDSGALLAQLTSEWRDNHGGDTYDMAHLMTGKEVDGNIIGLAGVGVVCNRNSCYGLSQSRFSNVMADRTSLTAHELGHNWNANHCDQENPPVTPCQIMCATINECNGYQAPAFEDYARTRIASFAFSRACVDFAADGVWVDFGWFGPQTGGFLLPFNTMQAALAVAGSTGKSIFIKPGTNNYRARIDNRVFLEAPVGNVMLGR